MTSTKSLIERMLAQVGSAKPDAGQVLPFARIVHHLAEASRDPLVAADPAARALVDYLMLAIVTGHNPATGKIDPASLFPEAYREQARKNATKPRSRDALTEFIRVQVRKNQKLTEPQLMAAIGREQLKRDTWIRSTGAGSRRNDIVFLDGGREKRVPVTAIKDRLRRAKDEIK